MSVAQDPVHHDIVAVAARADRAPALAEMRLAGAIADFNMPDDARLDDRTRLMLAHVLTGIIAAIEADVRRHAARSLGGRGATRQAEVVLAGGGDVVARLTRAGLLRDAELMDELIARVRQDLIADALPTAISEAEAPSLLVRLAGVPDRVVAAAAAALLVAESRRRAANELGEIADSELPAELHHRLVWWVAAGLSDMPADPDIDRAIVVAAQRNLAAHDEGDRPEAVAMRLAAAIDALPEELPALLTEAIGDRRLMFFIAVLGHALGLEYDQARGVVLEPEGDRLWLALRGLALDRASIATIALALSDADPRRDIEAFADGLDAIAAIDAEAARVTLAPLALHRDFRAARRALARSDAVA